MFSQEQAIEVTFKADYNGAYTQLDSVRVINRATWSSDLICWPDTSISVEINPGVYVVITDAQGKIVVGSDRNLGPGLHSFRFFPG